MANSESVHIKIDPKFKEKVKLYCEERGCSFAEAFRSAMRDALSMAGYFDDGKKKGVER